MSRLRLKQVFPEEFQKHYSTFLSFETSAIFSTSFDLLIEYGISFITMDFFFSLEIGLATYITDGMINSFNVRSSDA